MNYITITNLDNYQHYKNRNMIWFKFHIDTLQDFKFMELTERQRWVFIGLICLACKSDNRVALEYKWLERTLNTTGVKDSIDALVAIGLLSMCYQDAIPIREDKKREDNKNKGIVKGVDNTRQSVEFMARIHKIKAV